MENKLIIVRGFQEDLNKFRALFRILLPDLKIIEKPLENPKKNIYIPGSKGLNEK